jgi:L-proline amide hydrolase
VSASGPEHLIFFCKRGSTNIPSRQGPSEFTIVGNFKDWEGWKEAHNIEVPTLLMNGQYDEVQDACVAPWFRSIPRIRWVAFDGASHMTHFEVRDRFMELSGTFLQGD